MQLINYLINTTIYLIGEPNMDLRNMKIIITIYSDSARGYSLNFLIYIHFQMEMEDSAEFWQAMYSPSLHRFQHQSTMFGPNLRKMITGKHWWMPGRVRQDILVL